MTTFLSVTLLLHIILWYLIWHRKFHLHTSFLPNVLSPGNVRRGFSDQVPRVAILVPARNEERYVYQAVRSLLLLNYPNYEIVVANDHSTDKTRELLDQLKAEFPSAELTLIDVPELPAGWMGKCHALYHAEKNTIRKADLYLFTDADIIHHTETLKNAVRLMAEKKADLFALMPGVRCISPWENSLIPLFMHLGVVSMNPSHLNDPMKKDVVGIGAFTLIDSGLYKSWGGHEAIKGEAIDDIALGLKTKRAGGRIYLMRGKEAVRVRMYTDLKSMILGFEKNMHTAFGFSFPQAIFVSFIFPLTHLVPLAVLIYSLLSIPSTFSLFCGGTALLLHLLTGLTIYQRASRFIYCRPGDTILFFPLGVILAMYILIVSTWFGDVRGIVRWRGRAIERPEQEVKLL